MARRPQGGEPAARASGGASKLEFALVVIVFGVLLALLLQRVQLYQAIAERTLAEAVLQGMRTGLRLRIAELRMHQGEREVAALAGTDPVRWLERPPANFAGELSAPQADGVEPGSWYFESGAGEIRYRVRHSRYFVPGPSGRAEMRFRIAPAPGGSAADGYSALTAGMNLSQVEPYRWDF